jgi:hypothetical protein
VNNPVGFDTNDLHVPASRVENVPDGALTVIVLPATALVGGPIVIVGAAVTLRVVCA